MAQHGPAVPTPVRLVVASMSQHRDIGIGTPSSGIRLALVVRGRSRRALRTAGRLATRPPSSRIAPTTAAVELTGRAWRTRKAGGDYEDGDRLQSRAADGAGRAADREARAAHLLAGRVSPGRDADPTAAVSRRRSDHRRPCAPDDAAASPGSGRVQRAGPLNLGPGAWSPAGSRIVGAGLGRQTPPDGSPAVYARRRHRIGGHTRPADGRHTGRRSNHAPMDLAPDGPDARRSWQRRGDETSSGPAVHACRVDADGQPLRRTDHAHVRTEPVVDAGLRSRSVTRRRAW